MADAHHEGPLRLLKTLHPEGEAIAHAVLVHPPGGVVGGDRLEIDVHAAPAAHAVLTTPGATRFYRSEGAVAAQQVRLGVAAGGRLEWLPLENIAYAGCEAQSRVSFTLDDGGEAPAALIGWDLLALGLPASALAFDRGRYTTAIEWPGVWLDEGVIDGADRTLLDTGPGFAGHRVLATAWLARSRAWPRSELEALLDTTRAVLDAHAAVVPLAGATAPDARLVLVRALGHRTEPLFALLAAVRAAWRRTAFGLEANPPRVWRT